ncbi:MAG: hypothetical protein RL698_2663 [Pseudomonadota bacterium]
MPAATSHRQRRHADHDGPGRLLLAFSLATTLLFACGERPAALPAGGAGAGAPSSVPASPASAPAAGPGAQAADAFSRANAADAAGRHAEAADAFAAFARDHGSSAAALYNLGNASARAGRIGEAVLAWERALVLGPGDEQVRANLRAVRRRSHLPEDEGGPWRGVVDRFGADGWARIASVAWYLGCALLLVAGLGRARLAGRPGPQRLLRWSWPVLLAVLALAVAAERSALADLGRAVVLGSGGGLRAAPFASAPVGQAVAPGEIVRPEREHEGWVLLTTAAGKSGWLEAAHLGRIGALPGPVDPSPAPGGASGS